MEQFLGALIISIGYFYQRRVERKKVLNQSLFSLLEIWSQINKIVKVNPADFVTRIKEYVGKKNPNSKLNENDNASLILITKLFKNIIVEREILKDDESLEDIFYQAIKGISQYSPVLAYELNKEHSIKHILTSIDEYIKSLFTSIEIKPSEKSNNIKQYITDKLQEKILKETLESMEIDLKKVAWKSSLMNYYRVKKLLKEKRKLTIDDKFFDSYLPELMYGIK